MNHFTRSRIEELAPDFVFNGTNACELYDIMEEQMLSDGFVMYDNDIEFEKEVIVNGVHELRYSCMVIFCHKRKGKYILIEASAQYRHIK